MIRRTLLPRVRYALHFFAGERRVDVQFRDAGLQRAQHAFPVIFTDSPGLRRRRRDYQDKNAVGASCARW